MEDVDVVVELLEEVVVAVPEVVVVGEVVDVSLVDVEDTLVVVVVVVVVVVAQLTS